jgi:hypothetical protein
MMSSDGEYRATRRERSASRSRRPSSTAAVEDEACAMPTRSPRRLAILRQASSEHPFDEVLSLLLAIEPLTGSTAQLDARGAPLVREGRHRRRRWKTRRASSSAVRSTRSRGETSPCLRVRLADSLFCVKPARNTRSTRFSVFSSRSYSPWAMMSSDGEYRATRRERSASRSRRPSSTAALFCVKPARNTRSTRFSVFSSRSSRPHRRRGRTPRLTARFHRELPHWRP